MQTETPVTHDSNCDSADCLSGKRNRFFRGKSMKAAEFQTEQRYGIERRRLLTRSVVGWGVVSGFHLKGKDSLVVGSGLALDRHGREIEVDAPVTLNRKNLFVLADGPEGCRVESLDAIAPDRRYLLSVHYAERRVEDVNLDDWCHCGEAEKNFICETAVFSLRPIHDCPCAERDCHRTCSCRHAEGCRCGGRGPHDCLCQWIEQGGAPKPPPPLCEWSGAWIDPMDGVALACVTAGATYDDPCADVRLIVEDDCGPRRLVKNNDLLYDLVRGCDLTRIEWISWGRWHRRDTAMTWAEFVDMLGPTPGQYEPTRVTKFAIRFSGPVDARTVTPDCFALMFTVTAEDTGWFETRCARIPSVRLGATHGGDPEGTTREVTLCVDAEWHEEVVSRGSKFKRESAIAQIEVIGDYILDCHGQAIDANARGFALADAGNGSRPEPSGNGAPGGVFVSVFRIDQRPAEYKPARA